MNGMKKKRYYIDTVYSSILLYSGCLILERNFSEVTILFRSTEVVGFEPTISVIVTYLCRLDILQQAVVQSISLTPTSSFCKTRLRCNGGSLWFILSFPK